MRFVIRNRWIRYTGSVVVLAVLLGLLGGGWYFAGVLEADGLRVDHEPPDFRVTIVALGDGTITLQQRPEEEEDSNLRISATWGITNDEVYGQLGDILSDADGLVTREYTPMVGDFTVGQHAYLNRSAYPHDPRSAHGLEYQEVTFAGPIGNLGAWYSAGESDIWAVLVHGRTSSRDTSLKILDDLSELGIHTLTIDYRNDEGAPVSESGYYDYGTTEWEDVEAATRYALESGASKIILIGYSMGGGIIVNYQLQSDLADRTAGLILDAPMLNFGRTVDKGAEERSVPPPITAAAKLISGIRFGVDWKALDFLSRADELIVPILLFHGDADTTVPIETSQELAKKLPELVELHTFADTEHVAAWNLYPDEYEGFVRDFIERVR